MDAVRELSPVDSSSLAKRSAARIGPMVWELDGPMPILNNSKRLCFIASAWRAPLSLFAFYSVHAGSHARCRHTKPTQEQNAHCRLSYRTAVVVSTLDCYGLVLYFR